ncbi:MAG: mechanosensitive ion channel family protein [Phycisphaera sp.]|nr:mechanosensitive ion channel family protein [Phycisphaera sp.]
MTHLLVLLAILLVDGSSHWTTNVAHGIPPIPQATDTEKTPPAKPESLGPPKDIRSPQATLTTLFKAFPVDDADDAKQAFNCFSESTLPAIGAVRNRTMSQFADLLDWLGWRAPEMIETLPSKIGDAEASTFVLFPWQGANDSPISERSAALAMKLGDQETIELERGNDGGWRFNRKSLSPDLLDAARDGIRAIQAVTGGPTPEVSSLEDWITTRNLPWLTEKIAFIEIWQWFALSVIVLLGLFLDLILRLAGLGIVTHLVHKVHDGIDDIHIRRAVRGLGIVGSTATWLLLLPVLDLPLVAFGILQPAAKLAFVIALFWWGWRSTDLIGEILMGRALRSETKADDILVPMIRKTLKVILVAFALVNLAPLLGLNLGPLLAAIGVGSFGFAFAFKNSLENLFGSVTVILDRPFQVGDWIVVDGIEGTVETVGIRSTRIRTFYNSLVSLPNSNLVTTKVDNYGLRKYRRWKSMVGILYGTPVPRIEAFCEGIREIVREHPYTRKDYYQVWVNEFGPSSIDILVYVFWEAPDWQTELRERHRFMIDIMRLAEAVGVDFAYPSQTIYLERGGEKASPKESSLDGMLDARSALRTGREAVRDLTRNAEWKDEEIPKYRFLNAEQTSRIDAIGDEDRAAAVQARLERREPTNLPPETGVDPENPDFTESRDAGG